VYDDPNDPVPGGVRVADVVFRGGNRAMLLSSGPSFVSLLCWPRVGQPECDSGECVSMLVQFLL